MPKPYDYSHLINEGTTNTEKVTALMNHSNAGPLIQAFVLEGIRKYADEILARQDELKEEMGEKSFICPDAWIQAAADAKSALTPKVCQPA